MKILVIEDEIKAAAFLQKGLTENGFVVDMVHNGEDGLFQAKNYSYDLLIIDVMMPKIDGWTLIERLRKSGCQTLALFLTARDSLDDRVRGLESGADAYLVKPFAFTELLAHVRTLLRRTSLRVVESLQIGDLEIDLMKHSASRDGRRLDLTPKEFSLLALLARRSGDVLSRALIADQVWNMNFDSDTNVVDVHIARLRAKVDSPTQKRLIQTVRGMGYVLRDEGPE
ncbi:MAG: heavy metal response regulator transcription factor [Pseudobdellovibrionaceae bacterium]